MFNNTNYLAAARKIVELQRENEQLKRTIELLKTRGAANMIEEKDKLNERIKELEEENRRLKADSKKESITISTNLSKEEAEALAQKFTDGLNNFNKLFNNDLFLHF